MDSHNVKLTHLFVFPVKAGNHPPPLRSRSSLSDTYKLLDSRFHGNDNFLLTITFDVVVKFLKPINCHFERREKSVLC